MRPDIEAINARAEKATKGWEHSENEPGVIMGWLEPDELRTIGKFFGAPGDWLNNSDFAVSARTDIPALIAYILELEAWNSDMNAAPKDREIMVAGGSYTWDGSYINATPFTGVACVEWDKSRNGWRGDNVGAHDEYFWYSPTYWRLMPEPPKDTQP